MSKLLALFKVWAIGMCFLAAMVAFICQFSLLIFLTQKYPILGIPIMWLALPFLMGFLLCGQYQIGSFKYNTKEDK